MNYTMDELREMGCPDGLLLQYITFSKKEIDNMIKKKTNGKFQVTSESGKNLGDNLSKEGAEKRLKQVEWFKNMKDKIKPKGK